MYSTQLLFWHDLTGEHNLELQRQFDGTQALSLMNSEDQGHGDIQTIAEKGTSTNDLGTLARVKSASPGISPSRVLKLYYLLSFLSGIGLALFIVHWISIKEISFQAGLIITLSFNVLLIMLLPLVLDWAEQHYFKARFLGLEEIAKTNPQLASSLAEQCERLAIPKLKLAIVESTSEELFSYGLWRINPRLILSDSLLTSEAQVRMLPSVEAELARFASQDRTLVFLMFTIIQELLQILLLTTHLVP